MVNLSIHDTFRAESTRHLSLERKCNMNLCSNKEGREKEGREIGRAGMRGACTREFYVGFILKTRDFDLGQVTAHPKSRGLPLT